MWQLFIVVLAIGAIAWWGSIAYTLVDITKTEAKSKKGVSGGVWAVWIFLGSCLLVWLLQKK